MSAWHSIETAPKDGTEILVCKATDADGRAIRREAFGLFVQRAAWCDLEGWIVYCSMIKDPELFFDPTHWMPIPAPPDVPTPPTQETEQ